jgi:60 kDa SS-A/Ro ribonucleoprotein
LRSATAVARRRTIRLSSPWRWWLLTATPEAKALAFQNLAKVCRIGTHLFHFAEYVNALRGWGRGLRNAVGRWYLEQEADKLAYQAVKYQQRDSWSHGDLLRLAHPKAPSAEHERSSAGSWPVRGSG